MKVTLNSRLVTLLGMVALVALLIPSIAGAKEKECVGDFTLTSATRWGRAVLPPGNYSFELDVINDLITIRGQNRTVMVMSRGHASDNRLESSALILVSRGRKDTVRALHLAGQKAVFLYAVPKESPEEIAQGPAFIQRVPVTVSGK